MHANDRGSEQHVARSHPRPELDDVDKLMKKNDKLISAIGGARKKKIYCLHLYTIEKCGASPYCPIALRLCVCACVWQGCSDRNQTAIWSRHTIS